MEALSRWPGDPRIWARFGRRAHALACGAALALAFGCGASEPPLVDPGTSAHRGDHEPGPVHAVDGGARWEHADDIDTLLPVSRVPFVSKGHLAGRFEAEVFANEAAATRYSAASFGAGMPLGSLLVKRHRNHGDHAPGPVFAMIKREPGYDPTRGDWEYVVTDPAGVLESRGPLPLCARCHAEARGDHLFGVPAGAR